MGYFTVCILKTDTIKQLVVPNTLITQVTKLGHETLLSGHQGITNSLDRIVLKFYWPGVIRDVHRFCQSCDICQKTVSRGNIPKAPVQVMPTINTPFEKVAIDVVGPITLVSERGNNWILTLVDLSTRYPKAISIASTL